MKKPIILLFAIILGFLFLAGCTENKEVKTEPQCTINSDCSENEYCKNSNCTLITGGCGYVSNHTWQEYECCNDSDCPEDKECKENSCITKQGCSYNNPQCEENFDCMENECIEKQGCLYENPPCSGNYSCINNTCINNFPCATDADCSDTKLKCVIESSKSYCSSRGSCSFDSDCGINEVCLDLSCVGVVNCTSGECEDNYFSMKDISFSENYEGLNFMATITAKTETKGNFMLVWNEANSSGVLKSIEMTYGPEAKELKFWIILTPLTYDVEHYLIEHEAEPQIYYLVFSTQLEKE